LIQVLAVGQPLNGSNLTATTRSSPEVQFVSASASALRKGEQSDYIQHSSASTNPILTSMSAAIDPDNLVPLETISQPQVVSTRNIDKSARKQRSSSKTDDDFEAHAPGGGHSGGATKSQVVKVYEKIRKLGRAPRNVARAILSKIGDNTTPGILSRLLTLAEYLHRDVRKGKIQILLNKLNINITGDRIRAYDDRWDMRRSHKLSAGARRIRYSGMRLFFFATALTRQLGLEIRKAKKKYLRELVGAEELIRKQKSVLISRSTTPVLLAKEHRNNEKLPRKDVIKTMRGDSTTTMVNLLASLVRQSAAKRFTVPFASSQSKRRTRGNKKARGDKQISHEVELRASDLAPNETTSAVVFAKSEVRVNAPLVPLKEQRKIIDADNAAQTKKSVSELTGGARPKMTDTYNVSVIRKGEEKMVRFNAYKPVVQILAPHVGEKIQILKGKTFTEVSVLAPLVNNATYRVLAAKQGMNITVVFPERFVKVKAMGNRLADVLRALEALGYEALKAFESGWFRNEKRVRMTMETIVTEGERIVYVGDLLGGVREDPDLEMALLAPENHLCLNDTTPAAPSLSTGTPPGSSYVPCSIPPSSPPNHGPTESGQEDDSSEKDCTAVVIDAVIAVPTESQANVSVMREEGVYVAQESINTSHTAVVIDAVIEAGSDSRQVTFAPHPAYEGTDDDDVVLIPSVEPESYLEAALPCPRSVKPPFYVSPGYKGKRPVDMGARHLSAAAKAESRPDVKGARAQAASTKGGQIANNKSVKNAGAQANAEASAQNRLAIGARGQSSSQALAGMGEPLTAPPNHLNNQAPAANPIPVGGAAPVVVTAPPSKAAKWRAERDELTELGVVKRAAEAEILQDERANNALNSSHVRSAESRVLFYVSDLSGNQLDPVVMTDAARLWSQDMHDFDDVRDADDEDRKHCDLVERLFGNSHKGMSLPSEKSRYAKSEQGPAHLIRAEGFEVHRMVIAPHATPDNSGKDVRNESHKSTKLGAQPDLCSTRVDKLRYVTLDSIPTPHIYVVKRIMFVLALTASAACFCHFYGKTAAYTVIAVILTLAGYALVYYLGRRLGWDRHDIDFSHAVTERIGNTVVVDMRLLQMTRVASNRPAPAAAEVCAVSAGRNVSINTPHGYETNYQKVAGYHEFLFRHHHSEEQYRYRDLRAIPNPGNAPGEATRPESSSPAQ